MIKIDRLVYNNLLLFKHFDWKISDSNLWLVRGINKDALSTGRQYSGNAIGKSLIFNTLATLWFARPPYSTKKNSAKDVLPKKGSAKLYGSNDTHKFSVEQRHHKKLDYKVKVDGKELDIKDISEQRKAIGRLLKLNEDHFYSFVYVHSFRPSALQIGSASQRYDFVESLFNLRIYDVINKKLLKIANGQKLARMQLPKLISQKQEITITPKEQKELTLKLNKIKGKLEDRISKLEKLNSTLEKYNTLVTLFASLKSEKTGVSLKKELKTTREKITVAEAKLEKLQQAMGRKKIADDVEQSRLALLEAKSKYEKILKNNHPFSSMDLERIQGKLEDLSTLLEVYADNSMQILAWKHLDREAINTRVKTILEPYEKIDNLVGRLSRATEDTKEKISSYSGTIDELSALQEHSICPTCLQAISEATVKNLIQNIQGKREKLLVRLETLKNYSTILSVEKLDARIRQLSLEEIESEFKDTKDLSILVEEIVETRSRYNEVKQQLLDLPKISKVLVSKESLLEQKKTLAQLQSRAEFLSSELSVHKRLDKEYTKAERESIKDRYKTLKSTSLTLSESIMPLNETVQKLSVAVSTGKISIENHVRLKQEIVEIEKETEDYDLIQTLVEIYSPKGVRIQHIETLVDNYVSLMNQYSTSIFSEPVVFSAIIKNNQFSILAERRGKISDVNSLSGAESRQFSAVSALVLRMLMPKELVPNILVFDEVEAGMSKTNRDMFFSHFLPLVQEHVPTVIIITPQTADVVSIPNATTLLLTREKGVTVAKVGV